LDHVSLTANNGVLSRLTLAGPPPLPGLLTKWPLSAALLGDDLEPGLMPRCGWYWPFERLLGDRTSRTM
jgi:hypothetical protein